jgi:hypothetical protein
MKRPRLVHLPDQRVTQTLASGITIRQDFRTATRFPFFHTGHDQWQYATHGGTLFVVLYGGKPYGLTCRHVLQTFDWGQLVVTAERFGGAAAGLSQVAYASNPRGYAVDTDILDLAVSQFSDDVTSSFFTDAAYLIDERTVTTSKVGDALHVHGALKAPSEINETIIAPKFCLLELVDDTPLSNDPTLRRGFGMFESPEFADVVGLSGSPVFNVTQSALCGMVVRGAMNGDACTLWYVDMFDVLQLLAAVHQGNDATSYEKPVIVRSSNAAAAKPS